MNITVYLGASKGNEELIDAVEELGSYIAQSEDTLVYGGSKVGLMGRLAMAALRQGGKVIGVEPKFLVDACVQLDEVSELIVTETMAQRKTRMIELGDAFIAFPGGTGTLEEITEVMSMIMMSRSDAPCIIYNLNGYYEHFKLQLEHMRSLGMVSDRLDLIHFADTLDEIKTILNKRKSA